MKLNPSLGVDLRNYKADEILSGKKWRITEKIDGVRRLFHKDNRGIVKAYSKSGKSDPWLNHITEFLSGDKFPKNIVYDTELVDRDLYFSNKDSYIMRAVTIGKAAQQHKDNKEDLMAVCFDMFKPNGDITIGLERDNLLFNTFHDVSLSAPIFSVHWHGVLDGNDSEVLSYLMEAAKEQSLEGFMLMNLDAPYIHGRSVDLIKVKRVEEFIGKIVDIELAKEGTKIEGGIAAIICKVPNCTIPVRVGSGFSNEERIFYAEKPPIGLSAEIEAFGRTANKRGTVSLNMPIFKRLVPSYNHNPEIAPLLGKAKMEDNVIIIERTN